MIAKYIEEFYAAQAWTDRHADPLLNHSLKIDLTATIEIDFVVDTLAKDFSEFVKGTDSLSGHCFQVVREVSYVLFDLGIKHALTIGDVRLPTGLYIGMSKQKLKRELRDGYKLDFDKFGNPVGVPANAHAWITLENGQIIDATILASMNRKAGKEPLAIRDTFYHFGLNVEIVHIPFLTGFAYHYNVLTDPCDQFYETYTQWYNTYFGFLDRLQKA